MADWSKPALTDTYANFLTFLSARLDDAAEMGDPAFTTLTNPPLNMVRLNSVGGKFERWNGSAWVDAVATWNFAAFNATGNVTLGDSSTDTVQVNGYMGVGVAAASSRAVFVSPTQLTSAYQDAFYASHTGNSAAITGIRSFVSAPKTSAESFTVADVAGYWAANATKGAGSTITNLHGVIVADQTQGTNNYGITSLVSAGTNKWNIYASGTARNYMAGALSIGGTTDPGTGGLFVAGNVTLGDASTDTARVNGYMGVGGTPASNVGAYIRHNSLTGATQVGVQSEIVGTSAATSNIRSFSSFPSTAASAFTCATVAGYFAGGAVKGAGSTITDQHGLLIADLTQGDNNYGITSLVSAGTNKWNIYASGTAANHLAGHLLMKTTTSRTLGAAGVADLQIEGASASASQSLTRNSADVNEARQTFAKSRGTAVGSNTAVQASDLLGSTYYMGADGTGMQIGAICRVLVDGTVSAGVVPARWEWGTTNAAGTFAYRMTLDKEGNLGLGVTPSAWGSALRGFDVGALSAFADISGPRVVANAYFNGTNWIYKTTAAASHYTQTVGEHRWSVAPSGTAGTTATFTQVMTLNASGALGFGNSPSYGTSGQVLTSAGNAAVPTWQTLLGAKGFVCFNGTGTVAIRSSSNVTSITDNGVGDYTVNWTSAFADISYGVNISCQSPAGTAVVAMVGNFNNAGAVGVSSQTTGAVRVGLISVAGTIGFTDSAFVSVTAYR